MSLACNFCGKSFAHTASRIRHVREQHGSLRTTCNRCGTTFSRACYFKVHNCKGYCENSNNTAMETEDNEEEKSSVRKDIFGKILKDEQGNTEDDDEAITNQTDSDSSCTEDEEYDTESSSDNNAESIEGETDEENTGEEETESSNEENTEDDETDSSNEENTEDEESEYSSDNSTEKYSSHGNSVNQDSQRYTSGAFVHDLLHRPKYKSFQGGRCDTVGNSVNEDSSAFVTDSIPRGKYNSFQGGRYETDLLNTEISYEKQGQNIERLILRRGNDCKVILETGEY